MLVLRGMEINNENHITNNIFCSKYYFVLRVEVFGRTYIDAKRDHHLHLVGFEWGYNL